MGEKVRLRALEPADADSEYFAITPDFDSESERLGDMIGVPVSPDHMAEIVEEMAGKAPEGDEFWLVIEDIDGNVVGNINSHSCSRRMGHFRYGVDIMYQYRGLGYGTEAVSILLKYFFRELRYHKCTVSIYSFNEVSIAFHEKMGFTLEGTMRDMVYTNCTYFDELIYGMTDSEYFSIYGK